MHVEIIMQVLQRPQTNGLLSQNVAIWHQYKRWMSDTLCGRLYWIRWPCLHGYCYANGGHHLGHWNIIVFIVNVVKMVRYKYIVYFPILDLLLCIFIAYSSAAFLCMYVTFLGLWVFSVLNWTIKLSDLQWVNKVTNISNRTWRFSTICTKAHHGPNWPICFCEI